MKILLVEDDDTESLLLKEVLTTHHYTVDIAPDGIEALELATSFAYDPIVLDLRLPKLDGISVCSQLHSQRLQTPILLLTAKNSSADIIA